MPSDAGQATVRSANDPVAAYQPIDTMLRMLLNLRDAREEPRRGKGSTEQRIIRSAVELFANVGYQATSMRDIAAKVGIKAASIYAHFPGKEALLGEAVRWVLDDFIVFVTDPLEASNAPREVLEILIKRHALYQLKYPSVVDAWHVLVEVDRLGHFLPQHARDRVAAQRQIYNDLIEALVVSEFPDLDNAGDRLRAVRTLCGRVGWWHAGATTDDPDEVADFVWSLATAIFTPHVAGGRVP